jgi:hypothetical protein
VRPEAGKELLKVTVDGQDVKVDENAKNGGIVLLEKIDGRWKHVTIQATALRQIEAPAKRAGLQGPIDDAFMTRFQAVKPSTRGLDVRNDTFAAARVDQFAHEWDKYFHGILPVIAEKDFKANSFNNLVLFGDPQSNALIAQALPKLPIRWTKDELVVNGVTYDAKTHVPVLIYPNPLNKNAGYIIINSGHTFREADLKGTNALLYPRLGDWAVIKPTPTEKDPAAFEVVAAGLFDENWQFPKK